MACRGSVCCIVFIASKAPPIQQSTGKEYPGCQKQECHQYDGFYVKSLALRAVIETRGRNVACQGGSGRFVFSDLPSAAGTESVIRSKSYSAVNAEIRPFLFDGGDAAYGAEFVIGAE